MSSSDSDELNPLSASFNPLKALYSDNVKLPDVAAPTLDNVSRFELNADGEVTIKPQRPRKQDEQDLEPIERDLTSVAGASQTTTVQRKLKGRRTVTVRMSEIAKSCGPLSRIATFCHTKQRVKVYIRSAASVRGHCEGFIVAYDKHWNLIMDDVDEEWTRKNKYKLLPVGGDGTEIELGPVEPKPYTVIKRIRGHQVCRRHVPRFLVRGEQIVLVTKSKKKMPYNRNI